MPLTCSCSDDYDWYYNAPDDFSIFKHLKRKRCASCKELIELDSFCLEFICYVVDDYGDEKYLANKYMCETCGELFFNFHSLGYCIVLENDSMFDLLKEYQNIKTWERGEASRKRHLEKIQQRKTKRFLKRGQNIDLTPYMQGNAGA